MFVFPLLLIALTASHWTVAEETTKAPVTPTTEDAKSEPFNDSPNSDITPEDQESFDHEAVAGSKKEARLLEQLSPEESRVQLGVLITKMDTNKDDKVSKQELLEWIENSLKNLDRENAHEKFVENDEDGDKKLTWPEYLHKVYGYRESELKELLEGQHADLKDFASLIEEENEKFKLADVNNDGYLSEEEHVAFHFSHHYPHMAPYEVKRTMNDFDKDKDGFIDPTEFQGDNSEKKDFLIEAEKEIFKKYDLDRDGKLNSKEIIPWVMPGFRDIATHEMEHLFQETDSSRDSILTREEILQHYESWVGSQATDYGRHLEKKEEL